MLIKSFGGCAAVSKPSRAVIAATRWPAMDHGVMQMSGWHIPGQGYATVPAGQYSSQGVPPPAAATHGAQQQFAKQPQPGGAASDFSASTDSDSDSSGPLRVPLKLVVQDAVKRWFTEALAEARRGDIKQQALVAQMYAEGYGCQRDLQQSRLWAERARSRGYQMAGVYCEL
eukprot:GHRR01005243.1.p1 GENE.GHRR01005243.1~~GHRR01005243.1.p1  ORF type:complete len:172 (+),score=65.70 GHRR01005243.1:228-743(+)